MTLAKLVEICVESGQPRTPLAVTRLELGCQLFERIGECVAEYRYERCWEGQPCDEGC